VIAAKRQYGLKNAKCYFEEHLFVAITMTKACG
jgi:hypothetical protein